MKKTCIPAAALAAMLSAASPAWAVISIESSITDLRFDATDLNPDDNLAAQLSWRNAPGSHTRTSTFIDKTWNDRIAQDSQSVQGVLVPSASSSQYGDARTSSYIDATSIRMKSSTSSVNSEVYANAWTGGTFGPYPLVVSPFTRVTVRGDIGIEFKSDSFCQINASSSPCGIGQAGINIELTRHASQPNGKGSYFIHYDFDTISGSDALHTPFVLTLDNNSDQTAFFGFSAGGGQWLRVHQAPVPEPEALAYLLVGLGTLAFALRKQQ